MNRFSLERYLLTLLIVVLGFLYALPNVYNIAGEDPALQIKAKVSMVGDIPPMQESDVATLLSYLPVQDAPKAHVFSQGSLLLSFKTVAQQSDVKKILTGEETDPKVTLSAEILKQLKDRYIIAQTSATRTPAWLLAIGAKPMKYGLDLQGGVHFLMSVDVDQVINKQLGSIASSLAGLFEEKTLRRSCISPQLPGAPSYDFCGHPSAVVAASMADASKITVDFPDTPKNVEPALSALQSHFQNLHWVPLGSTAIQGSFLPNYTEQQRQLIMTQVIETLNQRVNQLGVSDAAVVQQGPDRIAIDMPGIQDAAQAKDIVGEMATLEFHLVNRNPEAMRIIQALGLQKPGTEILSDQALKAALPDTTLALPPATPGSDVAGTQVLVDNKGSPIVLDNEVVLQGDRISSANASISNQGGGAVINIGLSGDIDRFKAMTFIAAKNQQQPMATVFIERVPTVTKTQEADGKEVTKVTYTEKKTIINVANVIQELGDQFQISGLGSVAGAQNLALLLRAGSLAAPVAPLEEEVVGPSLGKDNVNQGLLSIAIGFVAIVIFMMIYYGVFGIIANLALFTNLFLQVGLLSLLGATLTLPGIAGIVLTLGMAVDANVLIYERIREELRSGTTIQASLHAGFERAFVTIIDANVTTLIVAGVLFWVGAGPVKGFAVTLSIGILTSLFTAIMVTRALVNLMYGGRVVKKLSIGMRRSAGKS